MTNYINPSTRHGGVQQIVVPERPTGNPVDDAPYDDAEYVRINGEWAPKIPVVADTVAPSPPTGLSSVGTVTSGGSTVNYALTWVAPTTNADTTPLIDFAYYVVRWRYGITGPWASFVSKDPTALLPGLRPGVNIEWDVLARDYSGNDSLWARDTKIGEVDTGSPPQPSVLVLSSRLGTIRATWNGLDGVGAPPPADFRRLEVYMSATTGGPWTYVDQLTGAGAVIVTSVAVGGMRYFTTIAVDIAGNNSVRSGQSSITVVGVVGPDIVAGSVTTNHLEAGSITAEKIAAYAITADRLSATSIDGKNIYGVTITGSTFSTANTNSRVDIGQVGYPTDQIRMWNSGYVSSIRNPDDKPGAIRFGMGSGASFEMVATADGHRGLIMGYVMLKGLSAAYQLQVRNYLDSVYVDIMAASFTVAASLTSLKKAVKPVAVDTAVELEKNGVTEWEWTNPDAPPGKQYGLIADDMPVWMREGDGYQLTGVVAFLWEALKQTNARVAALEAKLKA